MYDFIISVGHTKTGLAGCGAVGKLDESNCTREISPLVVKYLNNSGYNAKLVQVDKANSYLYEDCYERAREANNINCNMFVEIHINSYPGGTGTEVLVNRLNTPICEVAERVCKNISSALNIPNRGVKQHNLIVLKKTSMPSMLIECCFNDYPDSEKYNSDIIARAITEALINEKIEDKKEIVVGWNKINNKWLYYTDLNNCYRSSWKLIDKSWYLFDSNGYAITGWSNYKNSWYYLDEESCEMATCWKKINNNWYYFNESGEMQTGWIKYNNKDYCLYSSGEMMHDVEAYGYSFDSEGIATKIE